MRKVWKWGEKEGSSWKRILYGLQGILSFWALGYFFWTLTEVFKIRFWGDKVWGLYPWAYIFFRPIEGHLVNYLVVCLTLSLVGLLFYLGKSRPWAKKIWEGMGQTNPSIRIFGLTVSFFLLGYALTTSYRSSRLAASFLIFVLPFAVCFLPHFAFQESRKVNRCFLIGTLLLLVLVAVEPIRWVHGPVYFMNEFLEVSGETLLRGKRIPNEEFLKAIQPGDWETFKAFYEARDQIDGLPPAPPGSREGKDFFGRYRSFQVSMAQDYIETLVRISRPEDLRFLGGVFRGAEGALRNLKNIEVARVREFFDANLLEALHQTMGRGQMNHIGHILNPINEYELGKPLGEIYFQYGVGYTLLLKWIMDRMGGISLENYYKTYLLYVVYFLSFFLLVWVLFPDRRYAFAAFAILPVCFYALGYIAFVLAPGVLPSIHLLDVPVTILLFFFFRKGRIFYALAAGALALVSIAVNRNFGIALSLALLVSFLLQTLEAEGEKKRERGVRGAGILLFILGMVYFFAVSDVGAGKEVFPYYLSGFYSWPAHRFIIGGTLLYLIGSYSFLIWLREDRSAEKYQYLFIFMYAQISLAYYFWSGLINHLPPVFVFVWLQLLWALQVVRNKKTESGNSWDRLTSRGIQAAVILMVGAVMFFGLKFYAERKWFQRNFENHSTYEWSFDRAKLISTIPPGLMQDSMTLIQKYNPPGSAGIYLISRYDGIIPFLARRYSAMPFCEMISFVFSEKERDEAIRKIQDHKPAYLFADRSILAPLEDRWAVLYKSEFFQKERASHYGRHEILREIFHKVRDDYEKIDEGELLAVYRRKPSS